MTKAALQGRSHVAMGWSTNEARMADWVSEHGSLVGSRQSGSIAILSPRGRSDDCGMLEGYGIEGSPICFKIDLKSKDPPVFVGKGTDDVDVWVK